MENNEQIVCWLIGQSIENLPNDNLPTNRDVISRFLRKQTNTSISVQASIVADEIVSIWQKFGIPHQEKRNIIRKINKLHDTYRDLKKNNNRKSETETSKREVFLQDGWKLFDIAHDFSNRNKAEPSKLQFLEHQRNVNAFNIRSLRSMDESYSTLAISNPQPSTSRSNEIDLNLIISDTSSLTLSSSGSEYEAPVKRLKETNYSASSHSSLDIKKVIDKNIVGALDRSKISNSGAALLIGTTANALGHDLDSIAISKETIRRCRQRIRKEISDEIFKSFSPDSILTVHWDGKMLENILEKAMVDRLCVIVSGYGKTKLLGVPMITHGTGIEQCEMVFKMLEDWNITENIKGLCFDTTASNVGMISGACSLLEKRIGRTLLWFACRHHIYELIVSAVFSSLLKEVATGPDIQLFQRFKRQWNSFNHTQINSSLADASVQEIFSSSKKENIVTFINDQLGKIHNGRDDYIEFLRLSLLFLGEPLKFTIRKPGAVSRARWMSKIIYCLKIYLFRNQFKLSLSESKALRDFNIFIIKIYLPKWFTCMNPTTAPRNDLNLLKELFAYNNINPTVSVVALKSFSNHLWYLSDTLIALSFFDENLDSEKRKEMVVKLEQEKSAKVLHLKKAAVPENVEYAQIEDFVSSNTKQFFEILFGRMPNFIENHPNTWKDDAEYINMREIVKQFHIVNDVAERGIGLIKNYNAILTHQEEYKQYLLQVVEEHYKTIPCITKTNIKAAMQNKK